MKNNRYRLTALATAVCFFTLSQQVQAQQKLTLKEAVQLSLTNSKKIRYDSARIAQATAALKEAVERKLPDVTASGSYMALNTPHISLKTGGNGGGGETPKVNQVSYGLVSASLPVFAGGKIRYGIEAARFLEKAEKLDAESNREEVVMNTVNAYAALYKTRRAIELIDSNLVQARQRVKDFTNLEKNGIIARNDLLKAELQQSNIELQLLDAQNNYKLACVSMDILTGLDEKTLLETEPLTLNGNGVKTVDEYEQLALQTRRDIQSLDARGAAINAGIRSTKADYVPSVTLTGGYVALYVPNFLTVYNAFNIGVGVRYSLSSLWKTKSKIAQQEAQVRQVEANKGMVNDQIRLDINRQYENYLLAQKKVEVYNKAIEQSSENYRITRNKYDNNLATTTDLLDADVAQLQSQLNKSFAEIDIALAYYQLLEVTGTLSSSL